MKTKRKAEITVNVSEKIDFKSKANDKESHYTMIKQSNYQENIIINIHNQKTKEVLDKWKDIYSSWIRKISIVKMFILHKAICRFSVTPFKIPMIFFTEIGKKNLQSYLYGITKDPT